MYLSFKIVHWAQQDRRTNKTMQTAQWRDYLRLAILIISVGDRVCLSVLPSFRYLCVSLSGVRFERSTFAPMRKIDGCPWFNLKNLYFARVFFFLWPSPPPRRHETRFAIMPCAHWLLRSAIRFTIMACAHWLLRSAIRFTIMACAHWLLRSTIEYRSIESKGLLTFTIGISNGLKLKPKTIVIAKF